MTHVRRNRLDDDELSEQDGIKLDAELEPLDGRRRQARFAKNPRLDELVDGIALDDWSTPHPELEVPRKRTR